jgi:hypothetical protein
VNGANYSFFNPPNNSWRNFPAPTVTASRKLKVDVTFKLQSTNDLIKLGTTSGIMLQDGPAHGAGEQPPPHPRVITDKVLFLEEQVLMLEDCLLREENYRKCLEHPPTDNPRGPREELHNIPSMKK